MHTNRIFQELRQLGVLSTQPLIEVVNKERLQELAAFDASATSIWASRCLDGTCVSRAKVWSLAGHLRVCRAALQGRGHRATSESRRQPFDHMHFRRSDRSNIYCPYREVRISAWGALMLPAAIEASFLEREFRALVRHVRGFGSHPPNDVHRLEIRCAAPKDSRPWWRKHGRGPGIRPLHDLVSEIDAFDHQISIEPAEWGFLVLVADPRSGGLHRRQQVGPASVGKRIRYHRRQIGPAEGSLARRLARLRPQPARHLRVILRACEVFRLA